MKRYLSFIIVIISGITMLSGLLQVILPGFILNIIGAEVSPASKHFFAIIGMFMFLFGAMVLHAIYSPFPNKAAILWSSFQKFGAAIAVGLGVMDGLFSSLASAIAIFDLISGVLILYYFTTLKAYETP